MRLGIMQPYFFPYLGYFDLINRTDHWVVFDTAQYTPKSWMNRNRILHPSQGWQYITLPMAKAPRFSPISAMRARDASAAMKRIIRQLEHYNKKAPYFTRVVALVEEGFQGAASDSLTAINVSMLQAVCAYLGIKFEHELWSESQVTLPEIWHPGQWALEISRALGAAEYVNPPGGREFFRPEEFAHYGIALSFTSLPTFTYRTGPYGFEPHLSILDVLMWASPASVKVYLDSLR